MNPFSPRFRLFVLVLLVLIAGGCDEYQSPAKKEETESVKTELQGARQTLENTRKMLEENRAQKAEARQVAGHWRLATLAAAVAGALLLFVGIAMGSQARRDADKVRPPDPEPEPSTQESAGPDNVEP